VTPRGLKFSSQILSDSQRFVSEKFFQIPPEFPEVRISTVRFIPSF
jgi:hypothetical protein